VASKLDELQSTLQSLLPGLVSQEERYTRDISRRVEKVVQEVRKKFPGKSAQFKAVDKLIVGEFAPEHLTDDAYSEVYDRLRELGYKFGSR